MKKRGAAGGMTVLIERDERDGRDEGDARELRNIRLEAGADGKTVQLVELDTRKPGIHREIRYEITPAELIAAIRANGVRTNGDELNSDAQGARVTT